MGAGQLADEFRQGIENLVWPLGKHGVTAAWKTYVAR